MAKFVSFHALVLVGVTLSVAICEDLHTVKDTTVPLPWEQLHVLQKEEFNEDLFTQNQNLYLDHHRLWGSNSHTALVQVNDKYEDLLKSITNVQKECNEKRDCLYNADEACCWMPGSKNKKQCVHEVPISVPLFYSLTRKSILDNVRFQIKVFHVPAISPNSLEILVLPVGQGDCTAMYCPNGNLVMFDCGFSNRQQAFNVDELKYAILEEVTRVTIFISHGDVDHYRYLPALFPTNGHINIDRVIIGGHPSEYTMIQQWMRTIASQNKLHVINRCERCIGDCNEKLHTVQYIVQRNTWEATTSPMTTLRNMNICGRPDIDFDIIAANVGGTTNRKYLSDKYKNQKSIVLKVTAGSRSMLLTGDMEGSAAKTVATTTNSALSMPDRLQSNVFQISHHGASTYANKIEWLQAIRPQEAFVSHAFIGQYGHPRCESIANLINVGSIGTDTRFDPFEVHAAHPLTCVKREQKRNVPYTGDTCHRIFSTYPAANTICTVRFRLGELPITNYNCYQVTGAAIE